MPPGTAIGKLLSFCAKVEKFRAEQLLDAISDGFEHTYSVNINALEAGSQVNVIPEDASCLVDVRTPPHIPIGNTFTLFKSFASESGVQIEELFAGPDTELEPPKSSIDEIKCEIYDVIEKELDIGVEKDATFSGSTGMND